MNFDPEAVLSSLQAMLGLGGEGKGGGGGEGEEGSSDGDSDGVESDGDTEGEEMMALMEEMDRELAGTTIGKSFETTAVSPILFNSFLPI